MPQKTDRLSLALFLGVIGAFVAAVLLGLSSAGSHAVGALMLAGGLAAVAFARQLTIAQHQLSEKPFIPSRWKEVRPFTFILWGVGVALVGLLQLLGF